MTRTILVTIFAQNVHFRSKMLFVNPLEKKVVPATRNLRTNSVSTMYYKVVTTMNK